MIAPKLSWSSQRLLGLKSVENYFGVSVWCLAEGSEGVLILALGLCFSTGGWQWALQGTLGFVFLPGITGVGVALASSE